MAKCMWCGRKSFDIKLISVVSTSPFASKRYNVSIFACDEHEQRLRGFYDRVRQHALLFIILTSILPLGLIVSGIFMNKYLWAGYLFSAIFGGLGSVLIIFPFCSPSTLDFMSVATSIKLARVIGAIMLALGCIGFAFGFPNG